MNKSLSIVIIGGRGLIGKTLTNELSKAGHRIICADINTFKLFICDRLRILECIMKFPANS